MSVPLRVVAPTSVLEAPLSTSGSANVGERVQLLQAEAQRLAREHVAALQAALAATQRLADEIALGGDVYPAGVRDVARRLSEDNAQRATTIDSIMSRVRAR